MNRHSTAAWSLAGLISAAAGWAAGGLAGSLMGRTIVACALTAAALGLLTRRIALGGVAAVLCAATAGVAWALGGRLGTPLVAWPAAALVVGAAAAVILRPRRAWIAALVAAPILGCLGFLAGAAALVVTGAATNDARLVGEFSAGGAAGFGCATLGGLRLVARWFDRGVAPQRSVS